MIRIFVFLALLFLIAFGAAWVADRPGAIVIDWLDYQIEVGILTALTALLVIIVAAMALIWLLFTLIGTPKFISQFFSRRRREKGYNALAQGIMAVGAGDTKAARKLSGVAGRLLPSESAALLLKAQTAQLAGDRAGARLAFEAMLDQSESRLLGLRGLFIEAQREGEAEAAYTFARDARTLAPGLGWAGKAVFEYQCASHQWEDALATLEANTKAKSVDKQTAQRFKAVLLIARAGELESGEPDRARQLALEAHKLAPDLVPAATLAGRLLSRLGDIRKAMKVIEATWKISPHPDLAETYAHVRAGNSARDRLKRITALTRMRAHHPECAFALATIAIEARDWTAARTALDPVLRNAPTQRGCLLMAEIEEGEHGDRGRTREWLSRAVHAGRDPVWTADGFIAQDWAPVSPVSGRLDAFQWRVPVESLAAPAGAQIDDELLAPLTPLAPRPVATAIMPPAQSRQPAEPVPPAADPQILPAPEVADPEPAPEHQSETSVITLKPVRLAPEEAPAHATPPTEADGTEQKSQEAEPDPAVIATEKATEDAKETKQEDVEEQPDDTGQVRFPLPQLPDDPGPQAEAPAEPEKKRFKLF